LRVAELEPLLALAPRQTRVGLSTAPAPRWHRLAAMCRTREQSSPTPRAEVLLALCEAKQESFRANPDRPIVRYWPRRLTVRAASKQAAPKPK